MPICIDCEHVVLKADKRCLWVCNCEDCPMYGTEIADRMKGLNCPFYKCETDDIEVEEFVALGGA